MSRPTPRAAGGVLLGAVLYIYGGASEVAWLFLLAYWCWALVAFAFVYEVWNRRGLLAAIEVSGVEASPESPLHWLPAAVLRSAPSVQPIFEGDRARIRARIASAWGTRGPARLSGTAGGVELAAGFARVPESGVGEERLLEALPRGPLEASRLAVEGADPLGMFRDSGRLPDRELGLVLPRLVPLEQQAEQREVEASVASPRAGAGTELFGVREYRPGDSLRRIHWRLSARRGGLVVREYEPPGLRTLLLVLDPEPGPAADSIARLAAAEAWACIESGGRALAWSPGRQPTNAERSIWPVLEWLARYPGDAGEAGDAPRGAAEAVAITRAPGKAALEALDALRRRGVPVRAWQVGPGVLATDATVRQAVIG